MKIKIEGKMGEIHDLIKVLQDRGQIEDVQDGRHVILVPPQSNEEERRKITESIQEILSLAGDQRQQHDQKERTPNQE